MLKRIAPLCLSVTLATLGHAQDADPAPAAPQLTSRAVMTSEQVVRILDETVDWYRMLGIQQQSATQPSDLLILYANRQAADRVVALAFELARANAELLSSQAEMEQQDAPETSSLTASAAQRPTKSGRAPDRDSGRDRSHATTGRRSGNRGARRAASEGSGAPKRARPRQRAAESPEQHGRFAHETDANGSGVSALKEHINAIAASIPAANAGAMPELAAAEAQAGTAGVGNAAPSPTIEQVGARRFGLWDLGSNVLRLQSKLSTIDEVDGRTEALQQTFTQIRAMPEQQIKTLSARGDELGARPAGSDAAELKTARDEYDTIAWLFAQTSSILVPLTKAGVLLEQYRDNLDSWRAATRTQYRTALMTLAARVGLLLLLLAAVFVAGELWKRAVFNYVQEPRRRHQLLLVRRIVMWAVALAIVGIAFATEASSFATFAGLLTAGVAVAMQSVLVSIVGYFFLIGKYGLRVGDRVQIGERHRRSDRLRHRAPAFDGAWPAGRPDRARRSVRQLGGVPSGGRHLQADPRRQPRLARVELSRYPPTPTTRPARSGCCVPRSACSRSTATSSSGRRARWRKRRGVPPRKRRLKCSCGSRPAQSRRSFVIRCRCSARPRSKSACRARSSTRSMRAWDRRSSRHNPLSAELAPPLRVGALQALQLPARKGRPPMWAGPSPMRSLPRARSGTQRRRPRTADRH